jgi:hypothetical protein
MAQAAKPESFPLDNEKKNKLFFCITLAYS